jgi:hypothetical protein
VWGTQSIDSFQKYINVYIDGKEWFAINYDNLVFKVTSKHSFFCAVVSVFRVSNISTTTNQKGLRKQMTKRQTLLLFFVRQSRNLKERARARHYYCRYQYKKYFFKNFWQVMNSNTTYISSQTNILNMMNIRLRIPSSLVEMKLRNLINTYVLSSYRRA